MTAEGPATPAGPRLKRRVSQPTPIRDRQGAVRAHHLQENGAERQLNILMFVVRYRSHDVVTLPYLVILIAARFSPLGDEPLFFTGVSDNQCHGRIIPYLLIRALPPPAI